MAAATTTTSGIAAAAGTAAEPTKPGTIAPVASTSASADTLKYDIECPICLNVFEEPKQLSCGHVVCGECVINALRADGMLHSSVGKFRCPECRVLTIIPPSGLSTNYTVKKLVAQISQMTKEDEASTSSARCALCSRRVSSDKELFICVSCSPVSNPDLHTAFCESCRDACGHNKHPSCIPYDTLADEEYRCAAYGRIASTLETCEGDTRRAGDALKHLFQRATRFSTFYSIGQQVFELERHPSKKQVDELIETASGMARKLRQHCANVMGMRDVEFAVFLEQLAAVTRIREATQRAHQAQSTAVDPDDDDVIFVAQTTNSSSTTTTPSNSTTTMTAAATATVPTTVTTTPLVPTTTTSATNDTINGTSSANVPVTGPLSPDVLPAEISQIALSLDNNTTGTLTTTTFMEEFAALVAASDIPAATTDSTSVPQDLSQHQRPSTNQLQQQGPSTSQILRSQLPSTSQFQQQAPPATNRLQQESLSSTLSNHAMDLLDMQPMQDWSIPEESSSGELTFDDFLQPPMQIPYGESTSSPSSSSSRKRRRSNKYKVMKEEPPSAGSESECPRAPIRLRLRVPRRPTSNAEPSTSATVSSQPTTSAGSSMMTHHHEHMHWRNKWIMPMWPGREMFPPSVSNHYHTTHPFNMPVPMQQQQTSMRHMPNMLSFQTMAGDGGGAGSAVPSVICEPYAAAIPGSRIVSDTEF